MPIDPEAVERTLARFRASAVHELGADMLVQEVIDAAQSVFKVTGTGLMFVDDNQVLRYVAASDEPGRMLEVARKRTVWGPASMR